MNILLTNDDGIDSPGLLGLAEVFSKKSSLYIIAPDSQRSGFAHAFSYKRPIYYHEHDLADGEHSISVSGTPVDCVKMGIFWTQKTFDYVISGINLGANIGVDCFYSGTVGAATEGALQGVPSFAFSLQSPRDPHVKNPMDMLTAALLCERVFAQITEQPVPSNLCLSINIPAVKPDQIKGIQVCPQAHQHYIPKYVTEPAEDHRSVLFRPEVEILPDEAEGVDFAMLMDGWITITPLNIDRTDKPTLEKLQSWTWTL
jgi:5'-nucleotidase